MRWGDSKVVLGHLKKTHKESHFSVILRGEGGVRGGGGATEFFRKRLYNIYSDRANCRVTEETRGR